MAAVAAAVAALGLNAFAASASSRGACAPRGSRTIVSNRRQRAYIRSRPGRYAPVTFAYVCLKPTGRTFRLGNWDFDARRPGDHGGYYVWPIHLVGRYVAYVSGITGNDGDTYWVRVRDLATGRLVHRWFGGYTREGAGPELVRFVATRTGAAAWTTWDLTAEGTTGASVWTADATGQRRVDSRFGIDPRSLVLQGSTVTWLDAGVRHAAVLR